MLQLMTMAIRPGNIYEPECDHQGRLTEYATLIAFINELAKISNSDSEGEFRTIRINTLDNMWD